MRVLKEITRSFKLLGPGIPFPNRHVANLILESRFARSAFVFLLAVFFVCSACLLQERIELEKRFSVYIYILYILYSIYIVIVAHIFGMQGSIE